LTAYLTNSDVDKAMKNLGRMVLLAAPIVGWTYAAARMVADAHRDLGPTGLAGDLPNWHNRPGELSWYLVLSLVELACVLLILRPHSYTRSWRRALSALLLFAPWTLFFGGLIMHSGGIMVIHFAWLAGLLIGLAALMGISGVANLAARDATVVSPAIH
jgi:hypothetical protein